MGRPLCMKVIIESRRGRKPQSMLFCMLWHHEDQTTSDDIMRIKQPLMIFDDISIAAIKKICCQKNLLTNTLSGKKTTATSRKRYHSPQISSKNDKNQTKETPQQYICPYLSHRFFPKMFFFFSKPFPKKPSTALRPGPPTRSSMRRCSVAKNPRMASLPFGGGWRCRECKWDSWLWTKKLLFHYCFFFFSGYIYIYNYIIFLLKRGFAC